MFRVFLLGSILLVALPSVVAQTPYAGMQARSIKSLSEQQISDLSEGRGMGLALAAELNGYPGPSHAIDLAEQLSLSPDQMAKLRAQFNAMKAEAVSIGSQLIEEERILDRQFVDKSITFKSLEKATQKIGQTQAKLRTTHLKYHLSTVAVLTPEQVGKYNQLRGYSGEMRHPGHRH